MEEKVWKVLNGINSKVSQDAEVDLLEEGLIDSFQIVNIVMELENAFEIEIDPDFIIPSNFKSISSIAKLIENILKEA